MVQVQPGLAAGVERMGLASDCATHLAYNWASTDILAWFIGTFDGIAVILPRIRHKGFANTLAHDEQAAPKICAGSYIEQHLFPKVHQQKRRRIHTLTRPSLSSQTRYRIKMQFL